MGLTQRLVLGVAAVLLGAASHIFWDSLTHPGFWSLSEAAIPGVAWSRTLQDVSSVVGLGVLVLWAIRSVQQYPAGDRVLTSFQRSRLRNDALVVASAAVIGGLANGLGGNVAVRPMLARAALGAMLGLAVSIVALVGIDRMRARNDVQRHPI